MRKLSRNTKAVRVAQYLQTLPLGRGQTVRIIAAETGLTPSQVRDGLRDLDWDVKKMRIKRSTLWRLQVDSDWWRDRKIVETS